MAMPLSASVTKISSVLIRGSALRFAVMSSTMASLSCSVNGSNMASYMMVPNSGFSTLSPLRTDNLLIRSCLATSKSYSLKFCLSARELKPLKVTVLFDKSPDPESPYAILYIYSLKIKQTPHRRDGLIFQVCNFTLHEIHRRAFWIFKQFLY